MQTTLIKMGAVLALIVSLVISATAVALTVKKAGHACALTSERVRTIPTTAPEGQLPIFQHSCLEWHP